LQRKHKIAVSREQSGVGKQVLRIDFGNKYVRYMDKKSLQNFIKELQEFERSGVE
jgi:hypothetical protein